MWKILDKSDGLLPAFLRGSFEILCSANKQLGGLQHDVANCSLYVSISISWQDLREKNWKTMEALTTLEKACEEKLFAATKAKVSLAFLSSRDASASLSHQRCLRWVACLLLGAVLTQPSCQLLQSLKGGESSSGNQEDG